MTETRIGQHSDFKPHAAHRAMTPADAKVFADAAERYAHPDIRKALYDAGGDDANLAHLSRAVAGGRPASAWAYSLEHDDVVKLLRQVGEGLAQ